MYLSRSVSPPSMVSFTFFPCVLQSSLTRRGIISNACDMGVSLLCRIFFWARLRSSFIWPGTSLRFLQIFFLLSPSILRVLSHDSTMSRRLSVASCSGPLQSSLFKKQERLFLMSSLQTPASISSFSSSDIKCSTETCLIISSPISLFRASSLLIPIRTLLESEGRGSLSSKGKLPLSFCFSSRRFWISSSENPACNLSRTNSIFLPRASISSINEERGDIFSLL